ncbi:MAG: DUF4412 domain-containing protein [Sphingobacteriaceae bacterium]|nr:MAG: DUF4412 domain-containing protein [Sphingobacteriaceae bacterium]
MNNPNKNQMNSNIFKTALCLTLSAFAISASAQKKYTEGVITANASIMGNNIEGKNQFTSDSTAYSFGMGPANVKMVSSAKEDFVAVLVDIPVASRKIAAVLTPAEIEEELSKIPSFTFTPTEEAKVISGFKCKKVLAKEATSGKSYDVWVTQDISIPTNVVEKYYVKAGGFPVQYTTFQNGRETTVTVVSVVDQKIPKGTFSIPKDFTRISYSDLKAMGGN